MSHRLPAIRPKQALRALEKLGLQVHHVSGSHYILRHPEKAGLRVTLPWHNKDLKRGTLASILSQADVSAADFKLALDE